MEALRIKTVELKSVAKAEPAVSRELLRSAYGAGEDAADELVRHNAGCDSECAWDVDHFGAFLRWARENDLIGDYIPTEPSAIAEWAAAQCWPEFRDGYAAVSSIEWCE